MNPNPPLAPPQHRVPSPVLNLGAQAAQIMQLAVKYLLYERAEETALSSAFASLVAERHNEFHQKHVDGEGKPVPWTACSNQVCVDARNILAQTRRKEVFINPIAAQLMERYVVGFMPTPNNIVVRLTEKDQAQLPDTVKEKREASKIIIAS